MNFIVFLTFLLTIIHCSAGPLEDLANMPDLTLFYQQLIRQQDIQMLLQNMYLQQQPGGMNDFTIFAPNNDAMTRFNRKQEDPNLLWKYHIVQGRYDNQMLYNMAQSKLNQANPRQMIDIQAQNNIPTIVLPFQLYYGLGFYGGTGPRVNDSYDNAGYGLGGISWLTHTSFNQTNLFDNDIPLNPNLINHYNYQQGYSSSSNSYLPNNQNLFLRNATNNNTQYLQNPRIPNTNYNSYFKQMPYGPMGFYPSIGILQPTINNAFILDSRPMSRGIIHVIDNILWPPERRDLTQFKTAYDALEASQFSRLRQVAERSDFFRSALRSIHHQTWFLPNDQAFASMGQSLSFLFDQFYSNNTNDVNEFIKTHAIPLVLFPAAMDSTKQITTLTENKWITFRKVLQQDHSFQVDVVCGQYVARILINQPEKIQLYGNGVVYPISAILTSQIRSAADELSRSYPYFLNLIQQSGDLELMNIFQGATNMNMFHAQSAFNITVLIPQQTSIQQLGNSQELSVHLRRHILRLPVYTDESMIAPAIPNSIDQQNIYQNWQQQPLIPQQPMMPQQQQPMMPQQQQPMMPQQQQSMMPQQQQPMMPQQQQPMMPQQQRPMMPQQQQPMMPQKQRPFISTQQQSFMSGDFNQQQFQRPRFQRDDSRAGKKKARYRRQMNIPSNTNFQLPPFSQQQMPSFQQQPMSNQPMMPIQQEQQQQQPISSQPMMPIQQQQQQQQQQYSMLPTQTEQFNPNYYPTSSYPSSTIFQHGQIYPTMDPQFSVEAQISTGANGNIVSLVGRIANSLPFTATIANSESNILIKNGVMHAIRGIVSGMMLSLEAVLGSTQGTSGFTQLLQQTRIIEQLKQSNRPYTLFVPTNAALQSIGSTTNANQLRHFVLRHICSDVLLDPARNVMHRSAGYYNRDQNLKTKPDQQLRTSRQKRQDWMNSRRNQTNALNRQNLQSTPFSSGYFQSQKPAYGDYSSVSSSFGTNNQLYNPSYSMNNYPTPNAEYVPTYNRTYSTNQNKFNYNNMPIINQPILNKPWNTTKTISFNSQTNARPKNEPQNYYMNPSAPPLAPTYTSGSQSCVAMTGERITVQPLAGTQPGINPPSMSYQNYIVTCCGDHSVNAMVQSYHIYPPNFAVYLIGRTLLSQGKTINSMYNHTMKHVPSHMLFILFIISLIFKRIQ